MANPKTIQMKFTVTLATVPDQVREYIALLETEPSTKVCLCAWRVHPDDVDVPEDCCRHCKNPEDHEWHNIYDLVIPEGHKYAGRLLMIIDTHPECPVHTKEGLVIGFLKWASD